MQLHTRGYKANMQQDMLKPLQAAQCPQTGLWHYLVDRMLLWSTYKRAEPRTAPASLQPY